MIGLSYLIESNPEMISQKKLEGRSSEENYADDYYDSDSRVDVTQNNYNYQNTEVNINVQTERQSSELEKRLEELEDRGYHQIDDNLVVKIIGRPKYYKMKLNNQNNNRWSEDDGKRFVLVKFKFLAIDGEEQLFTSRTKIYDAERGGNVGKQPLFNWNVYNEYFDIPKLGNNVYVSFKSYKTDIMVFEVGEWDNEYLA